MKKFKILISLLLFASIIGCDKDEDNTELQGLSAPANISALMTITQDNSGKVTFLPRGEGVTQYEIYYGDGTTNPGIVNVGNTIQHVYEEGVYQVKIVGVTIDGQRTETIQELTVSFLPPTNLVITATPGASKSVSVSATADLEAFFQVYYGEDPNQIPIDFMQGETVNHTYSVAGTYQIRVVALSGGVATIEDTVSVTVINLNEAPTPSIPAGNVISMFSDAYTNVPVDTWRTSWSAATLDEVAINGDAIKRYNSLDFVGIETVNSQINATGMTHFHTDVWSSNFTQFSVKLVDFGANGTYDGPGNGDDVEHTVTVNAPAQGEWVSLDIPLSDFTNLTTRAHISQLIYVAIPSGSTTVYIDNVFFYNQQATPVTAAPTPNLPAGNVISMFSDAYTNVAVDTWRTSWSSATLNDIVITGNQVKRYSSLAFVGIETIVGGTINASTMTHFHTDVWSSDFTAFRVKLVDLGANGVYDGPGVADDVEHEVSFTLPAQGQWVSLDIPLADFTNLITKGHIGQLIYSGTPSGNTTVYVDNVYFHN